MIKNLLCLFVLFYTYKKLYLSGLEYFSILIKHQILVQNTTIFMNKTIYKRVISKIYKIENIGGKIVYVRGAS